MDTTIKTEVDHGITAKIFIQEESTSSFLFLSQMDYDLEDGDEEDHLFIEKDQNGRISINGKLVNQRVIDELVRFIRPAK